VIVALVWPCESRDVMSTTSRSMLDRLRAAPVRRGRSPEFETATPRRERVPLKKLFAGLSASDSATPFQERASPVSWSSPS
jgi:hypothetical protein